MLSPYLKGSRLTIQADHDAPPWILNTTDATGNLARWRLLFSEVDFEVVHRTSVKLQTEDGIPRLPLTGMGKYPLENNVPVLLIAEAESEGGNIEMDTKILA